MGISVITVVNKSTNMSELISNFNRQSFEEKELLIIINDDSMSIESLQEYKVKEQGIRVYQLPSEVSLGLCLNFSARKAKYEYIAKWDEDYYGELYLQELWNIYRNMKCEVIYKRHVYTYLTDQHELFISNIENEKYTSGRALSFTKEYLSNHWFKDGDEEIFEMFYKASMRGPIKVGYASRYYYLKLGNSEENSERATIAKPIDLEEICEIVDKKEMPDLKNKHHATIFLFELTPYKYVASKHTESWMKKRLEIFKENLLNSLNCQINQDYAFYISYARDSQQIAEQCIIEAELDAPQIYWGEYIENIKQINQIISNSQYVYIVRMMEMMKIKETFLDQLEELEVDLETCRIVDCNAYDEGEIFSGGLYVYLYESENFINGERISLKNMERKLISKLNK